jgi:anti-anti-sigma factor
MVRSLIAKITLGSAVFLGMLGAVAFMMSMNILVNRGIIIHLSDHLLEETRQIGLFQQSVDRAILETHSFIRSADADSRDEALANLAQAQASFDALNTLNGTVQKGDFDFALLADKQQLQTRRQALLVSVRDTVNTLIQAVEGGDAAQVDAALEALEATEEVSQALSADTQTLTDTSVATVQSDIERRYQRAIAIAPFVLLIIALTLLASVFWLRRRIRQVVLLSQAAEAVAQGDLTRQVPVAGTDEISTLQAAFNTMVSELRDQQSAIHTRNAELQISLTQQQQLLDTVSQLSTPLLPVGEGVVVLPVVGHVDSRRAQDIMDTLLHGVATQRARVAILDITGIASIDSHVVMLLVRAMRAIELLGAQAILAGISSTMAQLIVEQGTDLGSLATFRDLRTAIEAASMIAHH